MMDNGQDASSALEGHAMEVSKLDIREVSCSRFQRPRVEVEVWKKEGPKGKRRELPEEKLRDCQFALAAIQSILEPGKCAV
jgi:uncharacterized protein (DUF169 family)